MQVQYDGILASQVFLWDTKITENTTTYIERGAAADGTGAPTAAAVDAVDNSQAGLAYVLRSPPSRMVSWYIACSYLRGRRTTKLKCLRGRPRRHYYGDPLLAGWITKQKRGQENTRLCFVCL